MDNETTITINIKIPKDSPELIRAIRRAVGFFKSLVETTKVIKK